MNRFADWKVIDRQSPSKCQVPLPCADDASWSPSAAVEKLLATFLHSCQPSACSRSRFTHLKSKWLRTRGISKVLVRTKFKEILIYYIVLFSERRSKQNSKSYQPVKTEVGFNFLASGNRVCLHQTTWFSAKLIWPIERQDVKGHVDLISIYRYWCVPSRLVWQNACFGGNFPSARGWWGGHFYLRGWLNAAVKWLQNHQKCFMLIYITIKQTQPFKRGKNADSVGINFIWFSCPV